MLFFNSICTIVQSHQQYASVPISPHPCQHLSSFCLIVAIPMNVKWYLIVVLICIFLMISDIENLFMCLSIICASSLEKSLFNFFAYF
uniref:Uncharacterized protein n=1 Tax=Equus caballus TaxID=9796 RepID=A0A9L0RE34_HORSE